MGWTGKDFERPWRLARGTAILSMLWVHGLSWSLPRADYVQSLQDGYRLSYLYLGGIAALALPGVAGKSFFKLPDFDLKKHLVFAWLFFLCGFVVNWLTWGESLVGMWDGLYFIGGSTVILGVGRKLGGNRSVLPVAVIVLIAHELIRLRWGVNQHFWLRPLFGGENPPVAWPLFPWLSLFLLSFVAAERELPSRLSWPALIIIMVTAIWYERGIGILRDLDVWNHNPFRMGSGLVIAVWCGLMAVLKMFSVLPDKVNRPLEKVLLPLSDGTFWIYLLHVPLGYRLATETFADVPPLTRIFLTPAVLILSAWLVGHVVGWVSSKRFRVILVSTRKRSVG